MFDEQKFCSLTGGQRMGYVLRIGFSLRELSVIVSEDSRNILNVLRRKNVPDKHKEPKLYEVHDKLYWVLMLVHKALEEQGVNEESDKSLRRFLEETTRFRSMKIEPPWYPPLERPGATIPPWIPKNLREYLLEGRMVAVMAALKWRWEHM
jgi:hypothetical protein